jgi:hypothetical protein
VKAVKVDEIEKFMNEGESPVMTLLDGKLVIKAHASVGMKSQVNWIQALSHGEGVRRGAGFRRHTLLPQIRQRMQALHVRLFFEFETFTATGRHTLS